MYDKPAERQQDLKQKGDPVREKKEASAQEVRGYNKQSAKAKHLASESSVDNDVFDLLDLRKVKPRNHVTGRWVLTVKTGKQANFLKARARWVLRGCQDRRNIKRRILLLPQDPDFGRVAEWQPARVGTSFTLILRQLPFMDSLVV